MRENDISEVQSLDGAWHFSLGDREKNSTILVPGCWEAQGFPKDIDGPARYRTSIQIPKHWQGRMLQLEFGAVSYACQVWVNGKAVGKHQGIWSPFCFDLTSAASPGELITIEIEIFKPGVGPGARFPMRASLAGFLPDLAVAFGGIWQSVKLRAFETALADLRITADDKQRAVIVKGELDVYTKSPENAIWDISVSYDGHDVASLCFPYQPNEPVNAVLPLSRIHNWSPHKPSLYHVQVSLIEEGYLLTRVNRTVGFRRIAARGDQLMLNGRPFIVRGILAWGWEPDRIAPFYTIEQARQEMRRIRELGFNCIKLCLFVPNKEYFQAADEEGMLLWQEFPMWLPEVTSNFRTQAPTEYADLAEWISPHPSVAIYSLGCELNRSVDPALLSSLNDVVRSRVGNSLVCDNSGSGESYGGLDVDFSDFSDYHPYYDLHFFTPLLDHWRRDWQPARPLIFGEFCDSDTFRDLVEIQEANGGEPPWWMTDDNPITTWRSEAKAILDENRRLAEAGLANFKEDLIRISYKQASIIRKYTLESLRRRRGLGGYIITGLRDTPISTSGVFDDLGRPKWSADEILQTNADHILTIDLDRRRTWRHGGDRIDPLDPHNHWAGDLARWHIIFHGVGQDFSTVPRLYWQLVSSKGEQKAKGELVVDMPLPSGTLTRLGVIECRLPALSKAMQLELNVRLGEPGSKELTNQWPIWVYPAPAAQPPEGLAVVDPIGLLSGWGEWVKPLPSMFQEDDLASYKIILSTVWDTNLSRYVEQGGRVLLLQMGESPLPVRRCPFWREAIKFFTPHPLWKIFPHPGFTDMQFFGLASDLAFDTAQLATSLPQAEIHPLMRRLDAREFHLSEYIFEAELGAGRLLACTLNIPGGAGAQPAGLRRNIAGMALLSAMLEWLSR